MVGDFRGIHRHRSGSVGLLVDEFGVALFAGDAVTRFEHVEVTDGLAHTAEYLRGRQVTEQPPHHLGGGRRPVEQGTDLVSPLLVCRPDLLDTARRVVDAGAMPRQKLVAGVLAQPIQRAVVHREDARAVSAGPWRWLQDGIGRDTAEDVVGDARKRLESIRENSEQ